jgi:hypothetical protein
MTMQHRHLNTRTWTLAAVDSALERGDLPDWRELFAAAQQDRAVARRILQMAAQPGSASGPLACALVFAVYPELRPASGPLSLPARAAA